MNEVPILNVRDYLFIPIFSFHTMSYPKNGTQAVARFYERVHRITVGVAEGDRSLNAYRKRASSVLERRQLKAVMYALLLHVLERN